MFKSRGESLFAKLGKTRKSFGESLKGLLGGRSVLEDSDFDELEDQLIMADMGVAASARVTQTLRDRAKRDKTPDSNALRDLMKQELTAILEPCQRVDIDPEASGLHVILMVGVNGVGKTTTSAKLAHYYAQAGKRVMLAACDTFRAAATEQLQRWGERLDVPVVARQHGADAASVAHDAMQAALARNMDYLIIDTAGRQHVNADLMEQLSKVARVIRRIDAAAPHDVWLTVDAGNGQNVLSQIEHFKNAVSLTGLIVTKLDGTARGGVLLAVAERFALPIRFLGVGESATDLQPFDAAIFVDALVSSDP
ncbi:MAG: hypothetical protein DHS20C01_03930 [marine bacterium B5-7]|nr:MAG: hypothetical protein DHS20C01_03930 [marine bacterium B5-7]